MRFTLLIAAAGVLAAGTPSYAGPDDEAAAALALAKARQMVLVTRPGAMTQPAAAVQPVATTQPAPLLQAAPVVAAPRPFAPSPAPGPVITSDINAPTAAPVNTVSPATTAMGRTTTFAPVVGRHGAISGCST